MHTLPNLIVKQIKEEHDTKVALGYLADLIVEVEANRVERNKELKEDIKKLSTHITGNGCPEKGLLARFSKLEDRVKVLLWVGGIMAVGVIGWLLDSVLGLL